MNKIDLLRTNLNNVILGKREVIDKVIAGLLASGHILLEDVPGTGKTTLAKAVASSFDMDFKRIQFTPD
ncbi:MAG: AAA family ATPase, partial [Caldisericum exile]